MIDVDRTAIIPLRIRRPRPRIGGCWLVGLAAVLFVVAVVAAGGWAP